MTGSAPAMSPSDLPVEVALDRATGARREEADELLQLLAGVTGEEPVVWAGRIIGYGEHEFEYPSGHSGLAPELAFASGAREHTFYLVEDFATRWPDLLQELGKHRASKGCLYITRLSGVDRGILTTLLERSLSEIRAGHS